MKTFSIPDKSRKKAIRRDFLFLACYYFSMLLLVVFACMSGEKLNRTSLISTLIICVMLFAYWIYKQVSELQRYYKTYTLVVEKDHITEFHNGVAQSSFHPEQIAKTDRGGIRARAGDIEIAIPAIIGNKEQLLQLLPLTDPKNLIKEPGSVLLKKIIRYPFLLYTTLVTSWLFSGGIIHIIMGCGIALLLVGSFWLVQKRKNISQQEKDRSWWLLICVIFVFWDLLITKST